METVKLQRDSNGVVWLTLNRPEAGNSRNQTMREELVATYAMLERDDTVRVLVLTGHGDRFFCAGMDLKEASRAETPDQRAFRLSSARDIDALANFPKPTIAAINGYALGGGFEMALACDLRVMAENGRIGLPEVKLGLVPGGGATQRLPRLAGPAVAFELLYLGRSFDGHEAAAARIVNWVVPQEGVVALTNQVASEIAQMPLHALQAAKRLVCESMNRPLGDGLKLEFSTLLELLSARSPD